MAAYYVVCESLANTGKHAGGATAAIEVRVAGGTLVVQVTDDGVGGADPRRGSGLRGLADRVEALDGRLRVSTPRRRPGTGQIPARLRRRPTRSGPTAGPDLTTRNPSRPPGPGPPPYPAGPPLRPRPV